MAEETFYTDAADMTIIEGDDNETDGTILRARQSVDQSISEEALLPFDVGDTIGGGTITAAVLHYYQIDYAVTGTKPPTSAQWNVLIYTGSGWYEFDSGIYGPADGALSSTLDATAIGHIASGDYIVDHDTCFVLSVDDPGAVRSRTWQIEAFEHADAHHAYLVVTYNPAAGGTARTMIISC